MKKKFLITGCAGFIGFNLTLKLLNQNNRYELYGIDNLNEYYDPNLKADRLKELKKFDNFNFTKLSLENFNPLKTLLENNNFDIIIHLAAQAGVRYSFQEPKTYISSNLIGTYNLLEIIKKLKTKHFIFSSTSSTYGYSDSNEAFTEQNITDHPISLYASTKKSCEVMIHNYSHNFNIPCTVLRFFTVYGPWGRPDMALFKFVNSILSNSPIDVYNKGELWRDFTFIDDLTQSIYKLIDVIPQKEKKCSNNSLSLKAPYRVINIGNQNAVKLDNFISTLENIIGKKAIRINKPMQKGDVPYTLSNSSLLKNLTGYVPSTKIEVGIKKFYDWYVNYYIKK